VTRRRRGGLLLALAGAVGLLAAAISLGAGSDAAPAQVVVARQPLAAGLLIDESTAAAALATVPIPASLGLGGLLAHPGDAVGRRLAAPVAAGEPLTQAALGGAPGLGPPPLSVGERAVAVPLSAAGGAASGLQPGARVDVVASTGEGPAGRTALVVSDAEVLAVAPAAPADGLSMSGDAILRATSRQALRITAALNFAREVRLLIRPPQEVGSGTGPHEVAAP
jgi:Flp pilus assembly protein CpaB